MTTLIVVMCFSALALGIFSVVHLAESKKTKDKIKTKSIPASEGLATKALDRIQEWTKWMAGIQTTAIAFMGFMLKDMSCTISYFGEYAGFYGLLFFGVSILLCSWMLGAVPSMQIRIKEEKTTDNDIFNMDIFEHTHIRAGRLFGLLHAYFIAGVVCLSAFVFSLLD